MIITRTPYRISFFGGGTDYPPWFQEHGGAVLATTIDRYCYIKCRFLPPFFDHKTRVVWSEIELVTDHGAIRHPVIREVLRYLRIDEGVEIHHDGDLPARSGLGSSSAFTVGILNALYTLQGKAVPKEELARRAIYVEQELLHENVGVQDQIETAFGGLNAIDIFPDGSFSVKPVPIGGERLQLLQDHLLLVYTGVARFASDVAADKVASIPKKQDELKLMRQMVDEGYRILTGSGDIQDFGRLLHESWEVKRTLSSKVAPTFVNDIYAKARDAGALGGKLLGAGGGGFMLFFVPPERRIAVLEALNQLLVVPIEFDRTGTQVIFYEPDTYSRTVHQRRDFIRLGAD
ncbi:MAG TPA: kinase [Azospirillaceae bacterium]|nr:kinase [Azospirillaceae bacterium]